MNAAKTKFIQQVVDLRNDKRWSPAQRAYALAKAAEGAARECKAKDLALVTPPTEEEMERMCAETDRDKALDHPYYHETARLEEKYQTHERWIALNAAEDILVAWAKEHAQRNLGARYAQIAEAFNRWPIHGELRAKLIDICLRMDARNEVSPK